jgi:uncharacterized protein
MAMAVEEKQTSVVRRALRSLFSIYLAAGLAMIAVGVAITFFGDPLAGQPASRMDINMAQPAPPPPAAQTGNGDGLDLIEQTDLGPMPKIATNGQTPMQAYAGAAPGPGPKIAIVVGGLGIGAKETEHALNMLPTAVTLAFSPYAGDVQRWVVGARSRGHEVLISIPMEPYDYPENDPGQYALRAAGGDEANIQRLRWVLTRICGYTGATNLFGERFLTETGALTPVLGFLAKHGLLFFDTGVAPNSKTAMAAAKTGAYFARADAKIDTVASAEEIDRKLAELEALAKAHGSAVGSADLSPIVIERIALWSQTLAAKGIVLAPVSAVASQAK